MSESFAEASEISDSQNERLSFLTNDMLDKTTQEPSNTIKCTRWTAKIWNDWAEARNKMHNTESLNLIPKISEINSLNEEELENSLCKFVMEIRKRNGSPYPPNTLFVILAGIQRYMKENGNTFVNFLEKSMRGKWSRFHGALNAKIKELNGKGVGAEPVRQALEITPEQEKQLWDKGVMNLNTAKGISNAIFFYNSKVFGLRSADEHRCLKLSQFMIGHDENGRFVRFQGDGLYKKEGKLSTCKKIFKDLIQYENPHNPRCYYNIFVLYCSLLTRGSTEFYYRPLSSREKPLSFGGHAMGKNVLETFVRSLMKDGGFDGYYSNNSIQAGLCTELYSKGYNENEIAQRMGLKPSSIKKYKRTATVRREHDKILSVEFDPPPPSPIQSTDNVTTNFEETDRNFYKRKLEEFVDDNKRTKCSDKNKSQDDMSMNDYYHGHMHENNASHNASWQNDSMSSDKVSNFSETDHSLNVDELLENVQSGNASNDIPDNIEIAPKVSVSHQIGSDTVSSNHVTERTNTAFKTGPQVTLSNQTDMVKSNDISERTKTLPCVTVPDQSDKTVLCSGCGCKIKDESNNFEINIGDFMRNSSANTPTNISLKGITTESGSQLIIKLDFGENKS